MPDKIFETLDDLKLLTLCAYGEARGDGLTGILGVACVIMNRAENPSWWGTDIKSVILKPKQFSCFNDDDPNVSQLRHIAKYFDQCMETLSMLKACYWICKGALQGSLISNVGSATHYHTLDVSPEWKDSMRYICQVGRHKFYQEGKGK